MTERKTTDELAALLAGVLIVRKEEKRVSTMYGAGVVFTDPEVQEIYTEQDDPEKARITALQKTKLTGHEPKLVYWTTDDGDKIMLWPSEERMSYREYTERFPDDPRFQDPERLQA